MGGYNITTIVFLVNSFKDITDSYGRINRTVALYKRQVESMLSTNTISVNNKDIVYELLGIVNTNNIKWVITDGKISQFLYVVNIIGENRDETYINRVINKLLSTNSISESVANIIKKIYR